LQGKNDESKSFGHVLSDHGKFIFNGFGASGTKDRRDGLCMLPLNAYNQALYVFLWVLFYGLLTISIFTSCIDCWCATHALQGGMLISQALYWTFNANALIVFSGLCSTVHSDSEKNLPKFRRPNI
jgi:hypothetical protein